MRESQKNLKQKLIELFDLTENCFSTRYSDLHVLAGEKVIDICQYLREENIYFDRYISDVKGQDWHGKWMIIIPGMNAEYWQLKQDAAKQLQ